MNYSDSQLIVSKSAKSTCFSFLKTTYYWFPQLTETVWLHRQFYMYIIYSICNIFLVISSEIVREMAHKSDSKLQSISTTRLNPQHHLWYAPLTAPAALRRTRQNIFDFICLYSERCGLNSVSVHIRMWLGGVS